MSEHELSEEENATIQEISHELLEVLDGMPSREALMALSFVLCETL
jgi:hypothetical protein